MRLLILLFLFINSLSLLSQDTTYTYFDSDWKEIEEANAEYYRIAYESNELWIENDYYISGQLQMSGSYLTTKKEVKVGKWQYWHSDGKVDSERYYNDDGEKTGIWKEWYENGEFYSKGMYKNDKKEGEWQWFFESGQISAKELYEDDEVVSILFWDEDGSEVVGDLESIVYPEYPGGIDSLVSFLSENLMYPEKARENGIEGRVIVTFIVNEEGEIIDPYIKRSVHPLLDEEGLRVLADMSKWVPGKLHNQIASFSYNLPLRFFLEDTKSKKKKKKRKNK